MRSSADILVVAATARELAFGDGWRTLVCGVGPVDAAVNTAAAITEQRPDAILHVGIAGARRSAALAPTTLVIGESARYVDLRVPETFAPRVALPSPLLLAAARRALPHALLLDIGTSAQVGGTLSQRDGSPRSDTGRDHCDVECMEGFSVLRAAQRAGVPVIEVRAISNDIEEPDRNRWHFDNAFAAITAAIPTLVAEIALCVR